MKHRSSDQLSSVKIVKNPKLSWSGNLLVRNFVGRNKLDRDWLAGPRRLFQKSEMVQSAGPMNKEKDTQTADDRQN